MNTYSRALRHISMKDVKRKHQQKLIEQKLKEHKEIEKFSSPFKYNWRKELIEEGMTTSNFYTTGQQGELDLSTAVDVPAEFTGNIISGHNFTIQRTTTLSVNYSNYNDIVVNISGGGGAPYWSDNTAGTFTPGVYAYFYTVDGAGNVIATNGDGKGGSPRKFPPFGTLSTIDTLLSFGSNTLTIPSNLKQGNLKLVVYQNANTDANIVGGVTPNTTFNSITLRGKMPINVFISLDDPRATSFVRTGSGDLSPEEKKNRLREMLEASDEYLLKILGVDFPGTGTVPPGEYDPFVQTPPGQAGDTPGIEIAGGYGLRPDGTSGMNNVGDKIYDPATKKTYQLVPSSKYGGGNEWAPVKQASDNYQDTQIAADYTNQGGQRVLGPHTDVKYDKQMKMYVPAKPRPGALPVRVAHYEPQGQVISEKKLRSPKEILNKIPGYYDGKPAPLGFPVEQPPKMINGMHPDLVDGKKSADRFNRLDPESARAMPLTGNPHIDKKVKAARKKPK